MALLLTKVGSLFIKTLVKPIASRMALQAEHHPKTRNYIVQLGQLAHTIETRVTLRLQGHTVKNIKMLPEEVALQNGAKVLTEGIIFTVGFAIIFFEVNRKANEDLRKNLKKKEDETKFKNALESRFIKLEMRIAQLENQQLESQSQISKLIMNNNSKCDSKSR